MNNLKPPHQDTAFQKFNIEVSLLIKETLLSNEINNILSKQDKNISPPIKYPNGYLILKINEKRIVKEEINIDKELDELYNFEPLNN